MGIFGRIRVAGMPDGFEERQFSIDGVTLNYVVGPDNGRPLLLIPGQMESWQGYKPVLPELCKRFHIYVPDLRGHGKSTWTPGQYSYNICGTDLGHFIEEVIREPTIVAGLSSGGVLAVWLAAYAPEDVSAVICEDPPIFSSTWPRIQEEKLMAHNFRVAVEILGQPGKRDVARYLREVGIPVGGKPELLHIPRLIINVIFFLDWVSRTLRPKSPYDAPLLPFNMRAGHKFLSEYDTDFSRATLDGDLSRDFYPEEALQLVKCPMLLMRADAYRHDTWGLVGAIDDDDLDRIRSLVDNLEVVEITGGHEVHLVQPERYIKELTSFVDSLRLLQAA